MSFVPEKKANYFFIHENSLWLDVIVKLLNAMMTITIITEWNFNENKFLITLGCYVLNNVPNFPNLKSWRSWSK